MRTTLIIDDKLLERARDLTGIQDRLGAGGPGGANRA
jgi:hypothetical protein